ncbi:MAG: type II secretion system protein, partial [Planctomycetota bacterium]
MLKGRNKTTLDGFTLVELLVVIAVIAVLLSILVPALNKAREHARRVICGSNMHQWSLALNSYSMENEGELPTIGSCVYLYSLNASEESQQNEWRQTHGSLAGFRRTYYFGYVMYPYIKDIPNIGRCPSNPTWRNSDLDMWAQSLTGGKVVRDRDGQYNSQYCFFINSRRISGVYDYSLASGHGYVAKNVPHAKQASQGRTGNLILAQDMTYAMNDVYLKWFYPQSRWFNHVKGGNPTGTGFTKRPSGGQASYDDKLAFRRKYFGGANVLYLQGNVKWVRGENLDYYAMPGMGHPAAGGMPILGYPFFPKGGPGMYPIDPR